MDSDPFLVARLTHLGGRRIAFGRLTISPDRVEASGWTVSGRARRSVPLAEITSVDTPWQNGRAGLLLRRGAEELTLGIRAGSMLWKALIQTAAEACQTPRETLPLRPSSSATATPSGAPGSASSLRTGTDG